MAEAGFMTGLEASSGVVRMASYAPLLANAHARDWNPNLIMFDGSRRAQQPCMLPLRPDTCLTPDAATPQQTEAC